MTTYSSGYGYGGFDRASVLTAKGQTDAERARSEASLERIGKAIAASVAAGRQPSEASQDGPPRDAAHRAMLEKILGWRLRDVADGIRVAQKDVDALRARLAQPNADAAPLPNALEPSEQLVPELEEAPEGLDEWRIAQEIADYCAAVRSEVFRKTINDALRPHGWRVVRLPGYGRYDANGRWR